MKKLIQRTLAIILTVVISLGSVSLAETVRFDLPDFFTLKAEATSNSGFCGDNLTWRFDSTTGELRIEGTGDMWEWDDYNTVRPWGVLREDVFSVFIGSGVTSIARKSFLHFGKLSSVVFEDDSNLRRIGEMAFYNCEILSEIILPDSVEVFENFAFWGCAFESFYIPVNVKDIGQDNFYGQNGFLCWQFVVDENNKYYSSDEYGVLFNKDKTLLIKYPSGNTRNEYVVPDSVLYIGNSAFSQAQYLENVTLPSGLLNIGISGFSDCDSLKTIDIPASVMMLGEDAFSVCNSIETVNFEENSQLKSVGECAFWGCSSLRYIILPSLVSQVGEKSFAYCKSLEYIHIPSKATYIGVYSGDYEISVVYGTNAYICSDSENSYVKTYADKFGISFETCDGHGLNNAILDDEIIIQGFCGDNASYVLYSNGEFQVSGYGSLYDYNTTNSNENFYCPWNNYVKDIKSLSISEGITEIGMSNFEYCSNLESLTIPEGVTSIGWEAFTSCTNLKSVRIPSSVVKIAEGVFSDCYSLTEVVFEENSKLESIESHTFSDLTSLQSFEIPENVKKIANNAFMCSSGLQCFYVHPENKNFSTDEYGVLFDADKTTLIAYPNGKRLESYTVPDTVETIGEYSFYKCGTIKNVIIPGSVKTIETYAFFICDALETVEIQNGVKNIGHNVFYNCKLLKSILIPNSVETIGSWILTGTTAEIRYTGSEKKWNAIQKGTNDFSKNTIVFNYGKTPVRITDPETGITIENIYAEDYDGNLSIEARECSKDESNFKLEGTIFGKNKLYDISIICNGVSTQPSDTVFVRIPLPKNFIKNRAKIYYINENGEKTLIPSEIEGDYIVFEIDHFSYYAIVEELEVNILNNKGSATINYGETLCLTAIITDIPADVRIYWYVDGVKKGEGEAFNVTFESGTKNIEVKLADSSGHILKDSDGNEIKDSESITVKAGFIQKLISFFKNLFGISRTIVQSICS